MPSLPPHTDHVPAGERRFRQLVEQVSDAFFIYTHTGEITDVNQTACTTLGYTREELLSVRMADVELSLDPVQDKARWERMSPGQTLIMTGVHRRKDGSTFPVEVRVGLLEVNEDDGGGPLVFALVRDVSAQQRVETALREANRMLEERANTALRASEARNAAVLEAALDCIITINHQGQVVEFNPAAERTFGYSRAEAIGHPLHELIIPPEFRGRHRQGMARYLETGDGRVLGKRLELPAVCADGRRILVELAITRIAVEGPPMFTAHLRDITERKRTEELLLAKEAAERANAAKSEFLSRMSHELRTPLNAILGFGQLLELETATERQAQSVDYILQAGRHLLTLVDDVLDIARIESGNLRLSVEPVELDSFLRESLDLVRPLATQLGVCLRVAVTGTGPAETAPPRVVVVDAGRLKQILLNLLSNAIKYNRPGGEVELRCCQVVPAPDQPPGAVVSGSGNGGSRLRLTVRDTGYGIAADSLTKLFTPFERLGAAHGPVEGTGLGLAVSRQLIEAMGGSVGVESTPGEGSTFWVELPIPGATPPPAEIATNDDVPTDHLPPAPSRPEATAQLLYIEDNASNLRLVESILARRRPGWQFLAAVDGRRGLELARERQPNLILLDFQLPGELGGGTVLERLRSDPRTRTIPVVMLSADATAQSRQRSLALGARNYLTKPLDVGGLLEAVDDALGENWRN